MRLTLVGVVLILVGMGVFEVIMNPAPGERVGVAFLFALISVGIVGTSALLPRLAKWAPSLKITIVALGATSLVILTAGIVVAGRQMFISEHDLTLLLVLMGFGVVASFAFGLSVSGPLTEALVSIGSTSSAIAGGDLTARTEVQRHDEAGRLARDVDRMARALEDTEERRSADESTRRAMFAAIGHDLRTPLASMRAAIEALRDGLADEPDRYLASLEADAEALGRLVDDIFLLARLESGDVELTPEVIDLTEIADETMEVFRPLASARSIDVVLRATDRVLATGSSEAVARVVRNLVDNALRHSPSGGEVTVEIANGTLACCIVTDQGAGFSPELAESAFDSFSRGDASRARVGSGAGLGLAIARGYVNALGGEIEAIPGPGGKVRFFLPPAG